MEFLSSVILLAASISISERPFGVHEPNPPSVVVSASGQTQSVASADDAADDPAIWIHPTRPQDSRVLGTDKRSGLCVYDLSGKQVQFLPEGRVNNVDVRQGVRATAQAGAQHGDLKLVFDIAAATNRTDNTVRLYTFDRESGHLRPIAGPSGAIASGFTEVYGVCMFHDRRPGGGGKLHVFACDKRGAVRQWRIDAVVEAGQLAFSHELVREFHVGSQSEGMVADDELGLLYVGEEGAGIWRYDAVPKRGEGSGANEIQESRHLVDVVKPFGSLSPDVEGIALCTDRSAGGGYLVASSQGDNSFRVYDRMPPNTLRGSFRIGPSSSGGLDAVEETDGLDVTPISLGSDWPGGVLVVQDGMRPSGMTQNFKLVRWSDVVSALKLHTVPNSEGPRNDR